MGALATVLPTVPVLTVCKNGEITGGMPSVMPEEKEGGKGAWTKIKNYPNLYRYEPKGTYYLRGRFGGAPVRLCLQTTEWDAALTRLEVERAKLRNKQRAGWARAAGTLPEALEQLEALLMADPSLKSGTRRMYAETLARMKPGKTYSVPDGPIDKVSVQQMAQWWEAVAGYYACRQANQMLMFVRRALKLAKEALPYLPDPTAKLKRVKVPRTRLELPTKAEFARVVQDIRAQRKALSDAAADYVEFMAYSGCRPKEIAEIEWRDVKDDCIEVWGGKERTKNGQMRLVPIIGSMRDLLSRMREKRDGSGKLFLARQPREALKRACFRLQIKHQRIYNLRHLFATTCLESGVDVPTFATWMGHKDGGTLAMKTYVQQRDEHRTAMAAKVTFSP